MDVTRKQTIDQMIKIAKENKSTLFKVDKLDTLDQATKFTIALKIKVGKHKVLYSAIYQAYQLWSYSPVSKAQFARAFAKLFEALHTGNNQRSYYMLNYEPSKLQKIAAELRTSVE
jgi:hypothetical protein